MNKYAAIFFGFILIIIVAYFATRQGIGNNSINAEAASGSQEVVVAKYSGSEKEKILKDTSGDYFMGSEHAPVVLIEYASLSCPHCAEFHEKVVEPLIPTYIETGKVKYVYRHYPLNKPAFQAAQIARCSGKDRFFSFIKVFFQSQKSWAFDGDTRELKKIAALGGIDEAQYNECLKNKEIEEQILKVQRDASNVLDVKSTPTIFINGHLYKGKHNFDEAAEFIDNQLKGGL